jgi:DNA-binding NtrC family response regulator
MKGLASKQEAKTMANNVEYYRMRFVLGESKAGGAKCAYLTSSRLSARTVTRLLEPKGYQVEVFAGLDELAGRLAFEHFPVVLVDSGFSGGTWEDAVTVLAELYPDISVVVVVDTPGEADWEKVILAGGYDAVSLARLADDLAPAVESARNCAAICGDEQASRARQAALMAAVRDSVRGLRAYDA